MCLAFSWASVLTPSRASSSGIRICSRTSQGQRRWMRRTSLARLRAWASSDPSRPPDQLFGALCHCRGFLKQYPLILSGLVAARVLRRSLAPEFLPPTKFCCLTFDFGGQVPLLLVESLGVHERAECVAVWISATKGPRRRLR